MPAPGLRRIGHRAAGPSAQPSAGSHAVPKRLNAWLYRHAVITFILMGVSFFVFGVLSLNLVYVLKSNIELILDYGAMVIADGAGRQFLELIAYGYLSLAFFMAFKSCEHILLTRLTEHSPADRHG